MSVGLIVPAYNEVATIARVVGSVRGAGAVIVVDDGSSDATAEEAEQAMAIVVRHDVNRGYDAALQSGFEKAAELGLEAVVTLDADGQHDVAVLDQFLDPLCDGTAELVLGIRRRPARVSEYAFNIYGRIRFGVGDLLCGLKGYSMTLYRRHGRFDGTRSIGTELALAGLRQGVALRTVPVPIRERDGAPRFGSAMRANGRIVRALALAIGNDLVDVLSGENNRGKETFR